MSWFVTNLIAVFLMPPLNLLLLLATGLFLLFRGHRFARPVILIAFMLLWLFSTPYLSEAAMHFLEEQTTPLDISTKNAEAIVILGGGTYFKAPEYGGLDTVSDYSLKRLRYGAKLQRETGKPVLVTGGKPVGNTLSEAQMMRAILEQEFNVPVRWTEETSDNTFENAQHSSSILHQEGIHKIYLVTHAFHMPRATEVFRRAGFDVVEAPTSFTTRYRVDLLAFIPNASGLSNSRLFMHEIIGLLWYRLKLAFSKN